MQSLEVVSAHIPAVPKSFLQLKMKISEAVIP